MESSYDPVFHQSGSSTPMSPDVPSGPASQYKANVNRTKTRKWVEAKTVDYGGDDWGGHYDDEPAEPEPQSQPPPKPHGPRSTAALSNSQPPSPAGPRPLQTTGLAARQASPAVSSSPGIRTPVGAPALHIQTQQHSAAQPPTIDTESPWRQGPPSRGSTPGIERQREMSPHAVGVPQSATTSSVYSAVAEFGQLYGDRGASPGPFQGQRQRAMSPGPQSASSSVPTRFPRRKSSLGQHDAPADTVYSPTQEGSTRQIGSRPGSSHTNAGPIMSPNKPWMVEETVGGPRSASPSGSMRSPTTTGKPLPFVRPADIYKKLEEEKEKVRRSVDSGRPSMDSLGLGRGSETASNLRAQSPAGTSQNTRQTHEQGQVRPDSDATSPGLTRVADVPFTEEVPVESKEGKESALRRDNDETITPRGARSGLPTVAERKSEYGIEGLIASYEARGGTSGDTSQPDASPLARTAELGSVPASQRTVPAISSATSRQTPRSEIVETRVDQVQGARELPELEKTEGVTRDESRGSGHPQEKGGKEAQKGDQVEDLQKMQSGEELRRLSTSPKLPELGRLSVFGLDLFSSSTASDPATSSSSLNLSTSSPPPPVPTIPSSHTILSPSSPLSTVLESPSSSSTPPQQDASLVQTRQAQGQTSGDQARAGVGPRSEPPSPADPLPRSHNSSPDATPTVHPDEHRDQHRHSHTAKPDPDAGTSTEQSSTGDRAAAAAPSSERPQAGPKNFTALHAGFEPVTSKSESEQPPSVDKALPALPSEVSVVTPDPQASQLAISAPIPIAPSQQGSAEGDGNNASSTTDPKMTLHPLLLQHAEQGKAIPSQVSASSSSQATSAPVPSSTPALKLPPVDDQASAPPKVPGPSVTDYQSYDASSSDNVTVPSLQTPTNRLSDDGDGEPKMPKKQLVQGSFARDGSDDIVTSPAQPSTAPPPPPVEMSRGETYMTALESPLSDSASPTKSDKLSAEILQSLSPVAPHATAVVEPADGGNPSSEGPSGAARESSFLPDLYDDYWSFAGAGNASDTNAPPAVPTVPTSTVSDAVPAALNVQSDDARPMSLAVANDDAVRKTQQSPLSSAPAATPRSSVDVFKTDVQAVTVELHRPVLSNRFSWERDGIEAAKVDIQVEPKSLADKSQTTAPVSTLSTEPASVGPAMNVKLPDPISEVTGTPSPAPAYEDKGKGVAQSRSPSPSFSFQQSTATLPPATLGNAVAESSSQGSRVHPGPLSSNPVMTFREILEEPLQTDRIREFNKARSHYAAADTGLETILEHLASQHPDIVAASRAGGATSEVYTHDMPSVQDVGGLLSPTALGTTPPSARHHSHTTAHLGPKTKEFFATAGKASKGLFSTLKAKGKKDSDVLESASGATSRNAEVSTGSTRLKSKRTYSWTATSSSIHDSFTSLGNALKSELKERRTSIQLPAAPPAPGSRSSQQQQDPNDKSKIDNVGKDDNLGLSQPSVTQTGSARRGRFSLSGLIIRTAAPQARQPAQGPLLAGDGVRQQQQHPRNPSQLNATGHPRLSVSPSFSQPPQLPKPARLSPFDLLSPSSPWSPPTADTSPALPPLPSHSLIGNDDNRPGANSQLVSPVSVTFSFSRRPTPLAKDDIDDDDDSRHLSLVSLDIADRLRVPALISKFQPTWNPYTGTPLFEEEGFEFPDQSFQKPSEQILQVESIVDKKEDNNRDGPYADQNAIKPVASDDRVSHDFESERVVLAPATTERTESRAQLHRTQAEGHERGQNKELLSEEASMATYAQQHQQQLRQPQQLQQQQFNPGSFSNTQPAPHSYQGQHNQSQASHPGWQAPVQTPNQAWEQSQLYDYQPGQGQARQPQQQFPAQQYQYAQHPQQQSDDSSPNRQSSFIGLPPIRRTSTLLSSVVKAGEDDNDSTSIASSQHAGAQAGSSSQAVTQPPQFANPTTQTPRQWPGTPQQYQIAGGYRPSQPGSVPANQQPYHNAAPQGMQQGQGSSQPQQNYQQGSPALHTRAFSGPVHPQGIAMANGEPHFMAPGQGQSSAPQFIPQVMRQNAGSVSPNAGGHIRLPPQGAWKLEESHLQQPLLSASRNRSPSNATTPQDQPFYGFDKETGLPAPAPTLSQQPQQSPQASQAGQQPPLNHSGQPQPGQVPRSDTADTADTTDTADLPPPGPIQAPDDKQAKRNSGLFSNIRGRFSREGPEDRRDSAAGHASGKSPAVAQHGQPTSDAISESSAPADELQEHQKRHSFLGGHALAQLSQPSQQPVPSPTPGKAPPANPTVNSGERIEGQGTPGLFNQRMQQNQQPQQMPPPENRKTLWGLQSGPSPAQTQTSTRPDMPRTSTSSNTITQADAGPPPAGINGGPKKRFSGLTSMFHRSGNNQNSQKPPGSSHSARPSFSHGPPGGSPGFSGGFNGSQQGQFARQPGVPGPMFAQQPQPQQPGAGPMFAQQHLRQQVPQLGAQQGPPQGQQQGLPQGQQQGPPQRSPQATFPGQQSPQQISPQHQPGQLQQGEQVQHGQNLGQQPPAQQSQQFLQAQQPGQQLAQQRSVDQQSPNLASAQSPGAQSPGSQPDGQRMPQQQQQQQQYHFPGHLQQQGPQPAQQQRGQQSPSLPQQPGQHSPSQQHLQQFQQQRLSQQPGQQPGGLRQPGQHLPQQQQQQQQLVQQQLAQQQPVQRPPGQQQQHPQQFQQQQRLAQQQSAQQQQQPGLMGPPPPVGRERSDSMGSRPFTPGDARPNPMMMPSNSSIGEERGRKPSGGGFFSSIFSGRSGSKTRDPKPTQVQGQPQGQQGMMTPPPGGQMRPGQQQYFGQSSGQQPSQYPSGQQRIASPLTHQQQQQGARPIGSPGQFGPPQPGPQQPGQSQSPPQGGPGQQQPVHQRQLSSQQRPQGPGQQPSQSMISQGGPAAQQGEVQGGVQRPMMYPQLQSQQSQASIASANIVPGQQQTGLTNGQRTPSVGQPHPNQQAQARETDQRTSPGPLNQHPLQSHPPQQASPPPQDTLRQETVSPPIDESVSKTGPPGSPPLTSPISQVSTSVPFTPIERQNNDSPLSFRQPAPSQQQPTSLNEPPRQILQTSTSAPSTQSPARKPIQSSPRPSQPSQASSVHGESDHSRGSPSISSAHTATATASPIDHARRPSQQLGQLGPQQTSSPLAQQPQLAIQQQPLQRLPIPGQSPTPQQRFGPPAGFTGQDTPSGAQPGQTQGGLPGQLPGNYQGVLLVGQQQQGKGQARAQGPGQQDQPYPGPQPPWMVGRTSTGASGPVPQLGQQTPGPYMQGHPQVNGQDKDSKGTISKLFNKAKEVTHSGPAQEKPEKEKGGKSRFGFLRSSKQPEQRQQQQQPLQGGPQFQGPPGRPVMPQESQLERLQQLQAQVSPTQESQLRPSPTPSPGPHLNYQHQRQSPPNGVSPQVQPTAGSKTPSPGPQQALGPTQGTVSGPPQQQQSATTISQHVAPHPEQGRPLQASPPGPHGRAQIPGFGQTQKPVNLRPVSAAQTSNEPQYGEVPIPTGYGKVHSEGRVEPAPVAYYMGPHGQFLPVQTGTPGSQPQGHPWVQPGTTQRQLSYGGPQQQHPGHGGQSLPQPTQQPVTRVAIASPNASTPGFPAGGTDRQPSDPRHPLTVQNPDLQTRNAMVTPRSETPRVLPTSNAFSSAPNSSVQDQPTPVNGNVPPRPEPERFSTAMSHPRNPSSPSPLPQHPGSPQSYPLPESAFSPVNPDARSAPTPPLPSPLPSSDLVPSPLRPFGNQLQMAVPERQARAVSQIASAQPTSNPTPDQAPVPGAQFAVDSGSYLQARSPSPQVTPERQISPEPHSLSPPQAMNINVQQANEHGVEQDNIYDATPRTETISMQEPTEEHILSPPAEEPAEPKAGGMSHEVLEHRDHQPETHPSPPRNLVVDTHISPSPSPPPPLAQPAPNDRAVTAEPNTTNGATPPPARSTPPTSNNPVDIFEEAKRKAALRDMEEKIPVFPTEPDMNAQALAEMAAKKKAEEERPQMSATSYPGQEWNPYGDGFEFEE